MTSEPPIETIVFDNGSFSHKYGIAGHAPDHVRPLIRRELMLTLAGEEKPDGDSKVAAAAVAAAVPSALHQLLPLVLVEIIISYDCELGGMRDERTLIYRHRNRTVNPCGVLSWGFTPSIGKAAIESSVKFPRPANPNTTDPNALWLPNEGALRLPFDDTYANFDDVEAYWTELYYRYMKRAPEEHPAFITNPVLYPKANKEKLTQLMFETFNVPALYHGVSPVLALYASGKSTGTVIDVGHTHTTVTPIWDGYALPHAVQRSTIGGRSVDELLCAQVEKRLNRTYSLRADERECVRSIKDAYARASLNPLSIAVSGGGSGGGASDSSLLHERTFTLLDGQSFTVPWTDGDMADVMEQHFAPANGVAIGSEDDNSLSAMLLRCIQKCDDESTPTLRANVVLAGGGAAAARFGERLTADLRLRSATDSARVKAAHLHRLSTVNGIGPVAAAKLLTAPETDENVLRRRLHAAANPAFGNSVLSGLSALVRARFHDTATATATAAGAAPVRPTTANDLNYHIHTSDEIHPSHMAWIGASILASLPEFQSVWYSKQEYDESGPGIVHHKPY